MRLFAPFVCLALTLSCAPALAHAPDAAVPTLRIGLDKFFRHATTLLVSGDGPFTLKDAATGKCLAHAAPRAVFVVTSGPDGMTWSRAEVSATGPPAPLSGPIAAVPGSSGGLRIARLDSGPSSSLSIRWHHYRGNLLVRQEPDSTLRVVNTIPLELYLYGVVPAEIGTKVPLEAMRAQAVAARTYALKNRGKCETDGFDLDDTTRCEGYLGIDGETALSNAAVDGTRGQVMVYQGALIDAPYSTDSGGITAPDDSGTAPYLQAVRDAPSENGPDYACMEKYHQWTHTFTAAELAALLNKDPRTQIGQFVSLSVDGWDASGRITSATAWGLDAAKSTVMKSVPGAQLRQILGYDVLRSTRVALTVLPDGSYKFDGKGWGHGFGMSQEGAVAMASPPYRKSYGEILKHYYVGIEICPCSQVRGLTLAAAH